MHRHKTGQQSNSKVITPTKANKKTRKSTGHVAKNCVHCKITVNGNFESKEGSLSLLHFLCFYPCEAPPNLIVQYSLCLSVCLSHERWWRRSRYSWLHLQYTFQTKWRTGVPSGRPHSFKFEQELLCFEAGANYLCGSRYSVIPQSSILMNRITVVSHKKYLHSYCHVTPVKHSCLAAAVDKYQRNNFFLFSSWSLLWVPSWTELLLLLLFAPRPH